jgi:hypothetical protein
VAAAESNSTMSKFIIHIGAPRTGTTVLQKHIFPQLKTTLGLTKRPYQASISNQQPTEYQLETKPLHEFTANERHDLLENRIMPGSIHKEEETKLSTLEFIRELSTYQGAQKILISSELLCDNPASLNCYSKHHPKFSDKFYIYNLIDLFAEASIVPTIAVCLREPIPYLASKYLRTVVQRESTRERFLSPFEFINKQLTLERRTPGSSALTPALHKSFLEQLNNKAKTIAFGFRDLVSSNDVLKLFRLDEPSKLRFSNYPRENGLRFDSKCKQQACEEIDMVLQQTGIKKEITENQIYN